MVLKNLYKLTVFSRVEINVAILLRDEPVKVQTKEGLKRQTLHKVVTAQMAEAKPPLEEVCERRMTRGCERMKEGCEGKG